MTKDTKDFRTKYRIFHAITIVFFMAAILVGGTAIMYAKPAAATNVHINVGADNITCADLMNILISRSEN